MHIYATYIVSIIKKRKQYIINFMEGFPQSQAG